MQVTLIRTLILYIAVVLALRMMGKRQVGQLQPSELVIAMMLSELASIPMESVGAPLLSGLIPIFTLIVAETSFSFLTLRSRKMRRLLSGSPTILIEKGQILQKELERLRYNIDDLLEELRSSGYANVLDVEYAIIESNGDLSVIPKSTKRPVTPEDLSITPPFEGVPHLLITDGIVNYEALQRTGHSVDWLIQRLNDYEVYDIEDVFLATLDSSGQLFIQKKIQKKGISKRKKL